MARPKRFTHPDPEIEANTIAEMKKQLEGNQLDEEWHERRGISCQL